MADDVPAIISEILTLSGDTQSQLGKRIGVSQSTINRWLKGESSPNIVDWDKAKEIWRSLKGIEMSLDEKASRRGPKTEAAIHAIVDDYLSKLPPDRR